MEDNENIKVKRCPYSHIADVVQNVSINKYEDMFAVACKVCGAVGPFGNTPELAVELWNNREIVVLPRDVYDKLFSEDKNEETVIR